MSITAGKKVMLIVVGVVALIACVLLLRSRRNERAAVDVSEGPSFEVRVETGLLNRPPWEIPGVILGYSDRGPWFNQANGGAKVGNVAPDHLELSADGGWDLLIETDAEKRIAPTTHLAFPIRLGGRPLKFDCRPADRSSGFLSTTTRAGSGEIDGSFVLELANCKNADSGKTAAWPAKPFTVRGSFAGLSQRLR